MVVTVERKTNDFQRQVWSFWVSADQFGTGKVVLVLDCYVTQARATRRHGWRVGQSYNRLAHRESTLPLKDVPLPDDVASEAKQMLMERTEVQRELRR